MESFFFLLYGLFFLRKRTEDRKIQEQRIPGTCILWTCTPNTAQPIIFPSPIIPSKNKNTWRAVCKGQQGTTLFFYQPWEIPELGSSISILAVFFYVKCSWETKGNNSQGSWGTSPLKAYTPRINLPIPEILSCEPWRWTYHTMRSQTKEETEIGIYESWDRILMEPEPYAWKIFPREIQAPSWKIFYTLSSLNIQG